MLTIALSIAPLVLIIVVGIISGMTGVLSSSFRKSLSDFCYYFGMPALLIRTIATAPPSSTAAYLIWEGYLVPVAAIWFAASVFARDHKTGRLSKESSSIAMGSSYGNVIMLGIPLVFTQFGQPAATTVALIVLVHSPVLFLAAALQAEFVGEPSVVHVAASATGSRAHSATLALHRGWLVGTRLALALRDVVVDLVTNPIIIAIIVGLLLRLGKVPLDSITNTALNLLGQATLPCVLLAMGLSLSAFEFKGEMRSVATITLLKLVAMPAMAWVFTTHVLDLPPSEVGVITLLTAMPTGANAYVFASRTGTAETSVSGAVAISTMASILTLPVLLAITGPLSK